ncbi:hypothetical protein LCGC14_2330980, partial [marine sediment metagenome]
LNHTFESFDRKWKGTEKAFVAARALGEGTTNLPFLLLYGGIGNGKTYLVEAIIIAFGKRNIVSRYQTAAEFFDYLKEGIQAEYGQPDVAELTRQFSNIPIFILDDLGVEYGTDWEWSRLEMIIDYRYRFRKITIVTTNKDIVGKMEGGKYIPGLRDKSERILSRFSDPEVSQLVLNKGLDYRQRK